MPASTDLAPSIDVPGSPAPNPAVPIPK